jgi:hypothetical protein
MGSESQGQRANVLSRQRRGGSESGQGVAAEPRSEGALQFSVGGLYPRGHGPAQLFVGPGGLELVPGAALRNLSRAARLVHEKHSVVVVCTRLAPPWINTHVLIEDRGDLALAGTWWPARRRLISALRAGGLEVDLRRTWFFTGRAWVQ